MAYNKQQLVNFLAQPEFMALLDTIGYAEGANYDDVVTYAKKITDFSDHPRQCYSWKRGERCSTASGRYQFLDETWDGRRKALGLTDFSPPNQDIAALSLVLDVRGVNPSLISNPSESNFLAIMNRLTAEWCSLPGTNRGECGGQPQKTFQQVYTKYREFLEIRKSGKVPPPFTGSAVPTPNGNGGSNTPFSFNPLALLSGGLLNDSTDYCRGSKPLTVIDAKSYRGCDARINISPSNFMGIGAAVSGISTLGQSLFPSVTNGVPNFVDFQPGAFIDPMTGAVSTYTITSNFGYRWGRMHKGIDLSDQIGKPINAVADGEVTYAQYQSGGYGNTVVIRHLNGFGTLYAHGSKLLVKKGDIVKQGQVILLLGRTGFSTGSHLHFEISPKYSGQGLLTGQVDPRKYVQFKGKSK